MRNSARINGLASSLAAGLLCLGPTVIMNPLYADQWDKKTVITINAPVQIPTTTLQPGTYTLRLLDSLSNRHIVTVWDGTGMKHITTVLAIPNYRVQPTGKSTFTFWETPADEPKALRAWFYPGDNFGQEFAYPKQKARELAALNGGQTVPTFSSRDDVPEPAVTPAPETPEATHPAVEPEPEPSAVAAAPAPVVETPAPAADPVDPEPAPAPAPAPEPPAQEPAAEKAALPQTASNWASILGAGVFAAAAGTATLRRRRRVTPEA